MNINDLKDLILERIGRNVDKLELTQDITKDLGVDSIDLMDLIIGIETKYNIRFDDERIKSIKTVGDFLDYTNELIHIK